MSTTPHEPDAPAAETEKVHPIKGEQLTPFQWQKGQSGNPKGRPRKIHSLTNLLRDELAAIDPKSGLTYEQLLAKAIVRGGIAAAARGNDALAKVILERTEGKVPDVIDLRALTILVNKPIEQMTLEELDAYDRELQALVVKYAPMGLPLLLKESDDTGSPGATG
jgi:hypothetical protein